MANRLKQFPIESNSQNSVDLEESIIGPYTLQTLLETIEQIIYRYLVFRWPQ